MCLGDGDLPLGEFGPGYLPHLVWRSQQETNRVHLQWREVKGEQKYSALRSCECAMIFCQAHFWLDDFCWLHPQRFTKSHNFWTERSFNMRGEGIHEDDSKKMYITLREYKSVQGAPGIRRSSARGTCWRASL